jgi:hypothetical protein
VYYYVNGQAIASRHLDGHVFAAETGMLVAVVLAIILTTLTIIKRKAGLLKWLVIPLIPVAFAPIHLYIGTLFACCPTWW